MLSIKVKKEISEKVQAILKSVTDDELPSGEISFVLHIDGAERWSWANIKNNGATDFSVPDAIDRNLSA